MKELPVLRTLDATVGHINTHPEYSVCVRDQFEATLREQALNHSLRIETRGELDGEGKAHHRTGKAVSKDLQHLHDAREHLSANDITVASLIPLGGIVTDGKKRGLRTVDVQYGGFAAPSPETLLHHLDNLVYSLEHSTVHPVIRAIDAHIELVRIHPYEDGNGRSARLLQNFCLEQRGYPAAVIPHTEQALYIGLMSATIGERVRHVSTAHRPGDAETLLHKYLIGKVLHSAHDLEAVLQERREFEVVLHGMSDKGAAYAVSHVIRGYNHKEGGKDIRVNIQKGTERNSAKLTVRGNVSSEEIDHAIRSTHHKGFRSYHITPTRCID